MSLMYQLDELSARGIEPNGVVFNAATAHKVMMHALPIEHLAGGKYMGLDIIWDQGIPDGTAVRVEQRRGSTYYYY